MASPGPGAPTPSPWVDSTPSSTRRCETKSSAEAARSACRSSSRSVRAYDAEAGSIR